MDMKIGDLCWAKMKGFPSWPGKIIEAPNSEKSRYLHKKKLYHYIYFFGSGNYAWVPAVDIKPNSEKAIQQATRKRSISLQKAIQQLKREMERNFDSEDLEEKYCRQGIIKKCMVVIKCERLLPSNTRISQLKQSNNEISSPELCHYGIVEPQRKNRKIDKSFLNTDCVIDNANNKSIKCQEMIPKRFGFIGRGELGKEIFNNLLKSKCDITIWNQNAKEYGLNNKKRTSDSFLTLIIDCDIIVCCIDNENAVQSYFGGDKGILQSFVNYQNKDKGFVLLANVDLKISAEIAASIQVSGGRYLGASFLGSEIHATKGDLLILCSGDESLFHDCKEVFTSFNRIKYLGPNIELAPTLHKIIGLFLNSISKSYKEAGNLIQELKLSAQTFDDLLKIVLDENSLATLCYFPLEKKFDKEDMLKLLLENMKLKTLLAANFSTLDSIMQKKYIE